MKKSQWIALVARNAPTILRLVFEGCMLRWKRPAAAPVVEKRAPGDAAEAKSLRAEAALVESRQGTESH
jgi:hypothetical protein